MVKIAFSHSWYSNPAEVRASRGRFQYRLNQTYPALFDREGVLPMAVLPTQNTSPEDLLKDFDLLVLTGGGDVSPHLFGREDEGSRNPESDRAVWDIALYRAARRHGLPVLGICLGAQIMGIAEGVALIQDIHTGLQHEGTALEPVDHLVSVVEDTLLYSVFGEKIVVGSWHHQALEQVPPGYALAAYSADGMIEAIESDDGVALGVQWHPERDDTGESIVSAMLELAGIR